MKNLWVQTKNSEENFTNRLDQVEERVSALKTKKGWITQLKKVTNPLQPQEQSMQELALWKDRPIEQ